MGFFRIKNDTDAIREYEYCVAQIKAMEKTYTTGYDNTRCGWTFLTLVTMKYNERAHAVPPHLSHADKLLKKYVASFDADAKKLFKLQDRLATAKSYLLTHGYDFQPDGYACERLVRKNG